MPKRGAELEIPSTILRSDAHAQRLWKKAHDSAVETYGEGGRAHRVAYAALKHEYEKRGDKWVRKNGKGPSDPQAARGPTTPRKSTDEPAAPTAGGKVAANESDARRKAADARREASRSRRANRLGLGANEADQEELERSRAQPASSKRPSIYRAWRPASAGST